MGTTGSALTRTHSCVLPPPRFLGPLPPAARGCSHPCSTLAQPILERPTNRLPPLTQKPACQLHPCQILCQGATESPSTGRHTIGMSVHATRIWALYPRERGRDLSGALCCVLGSSRVRAWWTLRERLTDVPTDGRMSPEVLAVHAGACLPWAACTLAGGRSRKPQGLPRQGPGSASTRDPFPAVAVPCDPAPHQ